MKIYKIAQSLLSELLADIKILQEYKSSSKEKLKSNIILDLIGGEKYPSKVRQAYRDIVSIIEIDSSLAKYIPEELDEYFESYDIKYQPKSFRNAK